MLCDDLRVARAHSSSKSLYPYAQGDSSSLLAVPIFVSAVPVSPPTLVAELGVALSTVSTWTASKRAMFPDGIPGASAESNFVPPPEGGEGGQDGASDISLNA